MAEEQSQAQAHKAWREATKEILHEGKQSAEQVRKAVQVLEAREAERIAAQIAEKRRQAALAAAAEERRQREAQRRAEEELRQQRAAELQARREEAAAMKREEFVALKLATANFHKAVQAESDYKEKWQRIVAMRDAGKNLGNAISKCQHAGRMKFSVMMVCEMRLKLREEKPEEESFRDHVHDALEAEWQVLNKAREELQELARQGEECRREMQQTDSLMVTGPSRENVKARQERTPSLPELAAKSLAAAPTTEQLLAKSHELVATAVRLTEELEAAVMRTDGACAAASARTTACFDKRKAETDTFRKSLERVKKEAKATISDAEKRLSLLKMRAHKTPETPRSAADTRTKLEEAETLVMQLKAGKRRIEADYRLKTSSFRIDKSCRELTKVRAATHVSSLNPLPLGCSQSSPDLTAG